MLKKNKKRSNLSKILGKKCENVTELHEKLLKYNIKYEITTTSMKETYYLLRENNTNYACKLCIDDNRCVFLTQ
jgi:hypothetical protein